MKLENYYYELLSSRFTNNGTEGIFHIALHADCDIYQGHFPGNPVCPGVCNIQVIKECAERMVGKSLYIHSIKQCRITAVATPLLSPEMDVELQVHPTENGYNVMATLYDNERTYLSYTGEMTV